LEKLLFAAVAASYVECGQNSAVGGCLKALNEGVEKLVWCG
jgi:hypothetical protein